MILKLLKYFEAKFEAFEQLTIDVVYNRRQGFWIPLYQFILKCGSYIFSSIVRLRHFLYETRILRNQPLGCMVLVVGNLTVGGTGKTPVVERLARSLTERGRKVAILSRGYKSKNRPLYKKIGDWVANKDPLPPKVVSDGKHVLLGSDEAGDEPFMLAYNLPGVVVIVDKNRVKGGQYAIRHYGVDTLILDDGFQYLPLKGRLNLLLVDKTNPFGNHSLLPRGILREPIRHLNRASYIFLTKSDGQPDEELSAIFKKYNPTAEVIECMHSPKYLKSVNGDEIFPLDTLKGKRIAVLSGIAIPESFEKSLRKLGAKLVCNKRFMDHHRFTEKELDTFFNEAEKEQVDMILTTEKDAVRIPADCTPNLPFYYLRLEIEILSGMEDFNEAVSRICFPKSKLKATRMPFGARVG